MVGKSTTAIVFILLFASTIANAQTSDTIKYPLPNHVIKFAPLSLFHSNNTFQLGYEYKVLPYFHLQHDIGYILPMVKIIDDNNDRGPMWTSNLPYADNGISVRTEAKLYLNPKTVRSVGDYLAFEIYYIQTHFTLTNTFGFGCINNVGCNYFRSLKNDMIKRSMGYHLKYGRQFTFYRFAFDYYAGFGFRYTNFKNYNFPSNGKYFDVKNYPEERGRTTPSISLGFKLGYVLK